MPDNLKQTANCTYMPLLCVLCDIYIHIHVHLYPNPIYPILYIYSYSIMRECWSVDKEARPTFLELREKFDGLISHEERYNYMQWNGECAVESVENATQPSGGDGSAAGLAEVIEMPPTEPIASSDSGPSVQSAVPPAQPSASSLDVELITTELA